MVGISGVDVVDGVADVTLCLCWRFFVRGCRKWFLLWYRRSLAGSEWSCGVDLGTLVIF